MSDAQCRVERTRRTWGTIFSNLRLARDQWGSAWYHVENKQAWIDEEDQRLQGIEKEVKKARADLEARKGVPV